MIAALACGAAVAEPQGEVMVQCWEAQEVQQRLADIGEARIAAPVGSDGLQYEVWGGQATGWTLIWVEPGRGLWCPISSGPDLSAATDIFGVGL